MNGEHGPGEGIAYALPAEGDGLVSFAQFAKVLGIHEATCWDWSKSDPNWPPLIRRGPRFTRMRLSDCRAYLAGLAAEPAKPSPRAASRAKA